MDWIIGPLGKLLGFLWKWFRRPQLALHFRQEEDVVSPGGQPYRVISLVLSNRGGDAPVDVWFQMQLPFLPPKLTEPIGPSRVLRPLLFAERDGRGWKHWKDWRQSPDLHGVTFLSAGPITVPHQFDLVLCQFYLPIGWFGPGPKAKTYECRFKLVWSPGASKEGTMPLDLHELAEGHN